MKYPGCTIVEQPFCNLRRRRTGTVVSGSVSDSPALPDLLIRDTGSPRTLLFKYEAQLQLNVYQLRRVYACRRRLRAVSVEVGRD